MNLSAKPIPRVLPALALVLFGAATGFFVREVTSNPESPSAKVEPADRMLGNVKADGVSLPAAPQATPREKEVPMATASPQPGQQWKTWLRAALGYGPSEALARFGKLPEAEIQRYLAANSTDPDAWIAAAYLREGKPSFREAALRFPEDPAIQAHLAISTDDPAERRSAIEKMRHFDPDNALADYLSALDHLKQGRQGEALQDLNASLSKADIDDFSRPLMQAFEDAHLSAGFQGLDSKVAANMSVSREVLPQLIGLSKQLESLQAISDAETAAAVRLAGLKLGQNLQSGEYELLIDQLVGMSIEKRFLNPSSDTNRLNEIAREQAEIQRLVKIVPPILLQAPPSLASGYVERWKTQGERQAMQWLEMQASNDSKP